MKGKLALVFEEELLGVGALCLSLESDLAPVVTLIKGEIAEMVLWGEVVKESAHIRCSLCPVSNQIEIGVDYEDYAAS